MDSNKNALIIYNPMAGRNKGKELSILLKDRLEDSFDKIDIKATEKANDARVFASMAPNTLYHSIFAIGGDGTVNEVVDGLQNLEKNARPVLGIIPGGTFNGVARLLSTSIFPKQAIRDYTLEKVKTIDLAKSNDQGFILIFSIGDIPEAIHYSPQEKKNTFSGLVYGTEIVKKLQNPTSHVLEICFDGKETIVDEFSHVLVVLSASFYGRSFVGTDFEADDGNLLFLGLKDVSFVDQISILPSFLAGKLDRNEHVFVRKAKSIKIDTKDAKVETDLGGDKSYYLPVEITVEEKALDVYFQNNKFIF